MPIEDPFVDPLDAALGYLLSSAIVSGSDWEIDLDGHDVAADQLGLALLSQRVAFERSGVNGNTLSGRGDVPTWDAVNSASVIAGVAHVYGNRQGLIGPADEAGFIAELAQTSGIETEVRPGDDGPELWAVGKGSLVALSQLANLCGTDVALRGIVSCDDADPANNLLANEAEWMLATTGPLQPGAPQFPSSEEGGVGWNNREAQSYRPDLARFADASLELIAVENPSPSTLSLPYVSGMVMSHAEFGFGRIDIMARLPEGDGLWPALWLLDAAACEAPGRCTRYESTDYHEIDIVETDGAEPHVLHTSVHWYDGRVRTETATADVPTVSDGMPHLYTLIRKPGLLIWLIDDEEVFRVAGPANADVGPHRSEPMYLIANLAVGGSFSGDRLLGPSSQWWGDARVPESFPDVGWTEATLGIDSISFTPLG